jgi:hypothetical protein
MSNTGVVNGRFSPLGTGRKAKQMDTIPVTILTTLLICREVECAPREARQCVGQETWSLGGDRDDAATFVGWPQTPAPNPIVPLVSSHNVPKKLHVPFLLLTLPIIRRSGPLAHRYRHMHDEVIFAWIVTCSKGIAMLELRFLLRQRPSWPLDCACVDTGKEFVRKPVMDAEVMSHDVRWLGRDSGVLSGKFDSDELSCLALLRSYSRSFLQTQSARTRSI